MHTRHKTRSSRTSIASTPAMVAPAAGLRLLVGAAWRRLLARSAKACHACNTQLGTLARKLTPRFASRAVLATSRLGQAFKLAYCDLPQGQAIVDPRLTNGIVQNYYLQPNSLVARAPIFCFLLILRENVGKSACVPIQDIYIYMYTYIHIHICNYEFADVGRQINRCVDNYTEKQVDAYVLCIKAGSCKNYCHHYCNLFVIIVVLLTGPPQLEIHERVLDMKLRP